MWLTHGAGKLRVALHTFTHVEYGCVLSYDYHCNTDDEAEYYNSKCLCGAQNCNTLYLSLAAGHFDAIMEEDHTVLRRLAMLVRACECAGKAMSKRDAEALASVGFGKKIFRNSPLWLKCYCAQVIATHTQHTHASHVTHCPQVIEFIKLERAALPRLLTTKFPSIYADGDAAAIEADGVYGLRLQNLAIMVDRVLSFLRRQPAPGMRYYTPLFLLSDSQAANKLVFGEDSIWETLKDFVVSRERTFRLKEVMESMMRGFERKKKSLEAAKQVLRDTAKILKKTSKSYVPAAQVLEVPLPATRWRHSVHSHEPSRTWPTLKLSG